MRKLTYGILFFIAVAVTANVSAQAKRVTINGKITSFEESLPLEGVSVAVKGDSVSTGTQSDGSFTLPLTPGKKLLLISFAGYEKQEVPVTNAVEYNIVLKRGSGLTIH